MAIRSRITQKRQRSPGRSVAHLMDTVWSIIKLKEPKPKVREKLKAKKIRKKEPTGARTTMRWPPRSARWVTQGSRCDGLMGWRAHLQGPGQVQVLLD